MYENAIAAVKYAKQRVHYIVDMWQSGLSAPAGARQLLPANWPGLQWTSGTGDLQSQCSRALQPCAHSAQTSQSWIVNEWLRAGNGRGACLLWVLIVAEDRLPADTEQPRGRALRAGTQAVTQGSAAPQPAATSACHVESHDRAMTLRPPRQPPALRRSRLHRHCARAGVAGPPAAFTALHTHTRLAITLKVL